MGYRPASKLEWAGLWGLFVLPAVHGCVVWIKQPQYPVEHVYISWLCALAFAAILMYTYHQPSGDQDDPGGDEQ